MRWRGSGVVMNEKVDVLGIGGRPATLDGVEVKMLEMRKPPTSQQSKL